MAHLAIPEYGTFDTNSFTPAYGKTDMTGLPHYLIIEL